MDDISEYIEEYTIKVKNAKYYWSLMIWFVIELKIWTNNNKIIY